MDPLLGAETGSADQRRHFRAARGSVLECAACLDIASIRGAGAPKRLAEDRALLLRVARMLSRLARER